MAPISSIRDQIYGLVANALSTIVGAPNFFYTVTSNSINLIHGTRVSQGYQEPYIYIYPSYENYDYNKGERGRLYKVLGMDIEAWVRSNALADMNTNVDNMLHDLELALLNLTLAPTTPYIIDIRLIRNVVYIEDLEAPLCAVVLSIECDYQTSYNDPSQG